jgi:hypothetical protein
MFASSNVCPTALPPIACRLSFFCVQTHHPPLPPNPHTTSQSLPTFSTPDKPLSPAAPGFHASRFIPTGRQGFSSRLLCAPDPPSSPPFPCSFLHFSALFCTFLHFAKTYLPPFQANPHSLRKTPGGGVQSPQPPSAQVIIFPPAPRLLSFQIFARNIQGLGLRRPTPSTTARKCRRSTLNPTATYAYSLRTILCALPSATLLSQVIRGNP